MSSQRVVAARLDDLSADGTGYVFEEPQHLVVARSPDEVVAALSSAESWARRGFPVVGFVSYEAASGLDAGLSTRDARPAEPFADLPLVYFCAFSKEERALSRDIEPSRPGAYFLGEFSIDLDDETYLAAHEKVRRAIAAGDTYQTNLTARLDAAFSGDPRAFYFDLALAQRSSHCGFIDTGRFVVLSASPELFFSLEDGVISTRPMKGTAPRGRYSEEDEALSAALLASPKERAENLMIVDLLRNDLGRVAEFGTVEVPALFQLERYETLFQLTSTVRAEVKRETGLVEIFRALFPSGSVTGAPKHSTMGLISSLEQSRRGVYCGAIGVIHPGSGPLSCEFSVAIRTAVIDRFSGICRYGTGGGITFDSDAAAEREELRLKAAILTTKREDFSLIETMAFRPEEGLVNKAPHLVRLFDSARYFGFVVDEAKVEACLEQAVSKEKAPRRVRLLLMRNGSVEVELGHLPEAPRRPVRIALDFEPIDSSDPFVFHKTTRREHFDAARARHGDVDDVLFLNEAGELTETTIANVALLLDGAWFTPPREAGLLAGVGRGRLLAAGELRERRLSLSALLDAEEIALVSSLRGFRPARLDEASRKAARERLEISAEVVSSARVP